ncbi:hypothetical protein TWF173_002535 [Orbilia oligospora]|uniref:Uncharacterized protein n=1 Tax=Arthrobotrys oligospora (strain ATCC 24927 / CBS 115.81 / DSM 1491) TaxID=756982 RepID=G1XEN6_ARTOA|nr:hypothetical protein AOL_s00080g271 [Orbilia oligospora ATCC 24927]EGX48642.1 hypothetical protein AOL_s00080g271 [Orbilia oligospora ATCC 24927]KAF3316210.1 hypothetical protein TWF173_002535 [Orbilia oligospora]
MVVCIDARPDIMMGPLKTPFTEMFNIKHPVSLAGMNIAAGPRLGAAVIEAGGFACLGGNGYAKSQEYDTLSYDEFYNEFMAHQTPEKVRTQIRELKAFLENPIDAPFGVDILLPQIGGGARKTNYDYTSGRSEEIIDVVIEEGAKLFVSALGAPPAHIVDKLHRAGVIVGTNIGHPKHVAKVLDAGCDLIVATGGEGGGHGSDVATMILIPMVLEACRGRISKFTGRPIVVLAAGGIYNSMGVAASLAMGADGVWCGTKFVAATESGASDGHQRDLLDTDVSGTTKTIIYTGRPMRVKNHALIEEWHKHPDKIQKLTSAGHIPVLHEITKLAKEGKDFPPEHEAGVRCVMLGQAAGAINEILPAKEIIDEMVYGAAALLKRTERIRSKL